MSKSIVNLTLPVVSQIIEDTLETYDPYPYQQAFSVPDLRQKLVTYVLCRTQNLYTVAETPEMAIACAQKSFSPDDRQLIRALVHQGIQHILQENGDWAEHDSTDSVQAAAAPSYWFG